MSAKHSLRPGRIALALLELQTNPPPSLLLAFALGILLFGVWGNFAYDLAFEPADFTAERLGRLAIVSIVLIGLAVIAVRRYLAGATVQMTMKESAAIPEKRWVISALSPLQYWNDTQTNLDPLVRLLTYHLPALEHVYLVAILEKMPGGGVAITNAEVFGSGKVKDAYEQLVLRLRDQLPEDRITLLSIIDPNSAQMAYLLATEVLEDLSAHNNDLSDVVIDVTAGTKALTAGLTAAALAYGCPMSYQATKRKDNGEPDFSTRETSLMYLNTAFMRTDRRDAE